MNKKQKEKNKKTNQKLITKLTNNNPARYLSICPHCENYGSHFVPPCFGQQGFYFCKPMMIGGYQ